MRLYCRKCWVLLLKGSKLTDNQRQRDLTLNSFRTSVNGGMPLTKSFKLLIQIRKKKQRWALCLLRLVCWEVKNKLGWWTGQEFCTLYLQRTCNYGNESFTGDDTACGKRLQLPWIMYFCVWNKRPCANIKERKWVFAFGQINIGLLLSVSSNSFASTIHSFHPSPHKPLLHLVNNCRKWAGKMPFQENRANQVICTGISQIILGCCVFTLSFILSKRRNDLGGIFEIGVAYWAAPPVSTKPTASESNLNFIRASFDKKILWSCLRFINRKYYWIKGIYTWIFLRRKEQQLCFFTYRKIYILKQLKILSSCNNATAAQLYSWRMCFYFENPSIRFFSILSSPPWSFTSCRNSEMNL